MNFEEPCITVSILISCLTQSHKQLIRRLGFKEFRAIPRKYLKVPAFGIVIFSMIYWIL